MTRQQFQHFISSLFITTCAGISSFSYAGPMNLAASPLFVTSNVAPLTMLVMGRDHKLYYEAYNDASDLNDDGKIDVGYQGYHTGADISLNVDYFGYFNSYVCYDYNTSTGVFEPKSAKSSADIAARNKTCPGGASGSWSGDFLNYITTARMDAVRKVFYGGNRSTDSTTKTILERTHVPQDAHAWGKEYASISRDGYDISKYTNLSEPAAGTFHLFANVSLSNTSPPYGSNSGTPRLRVLNDTQHRVWEWLSKERPVAGRDCINGLNGPTVQCASSATTGNWSIVPDTAFSKLERSVYNITGNGSHPNDANQFNTLETNFGTSSRLFGSDSPSRINGSGNPFGSNDNYMTIFEGELIVPSSGSWKFAVDGDDAIDFWIDSNQDGTLEHYAGWYGGHGSNNSTASLNSHSGTTLFLTAGIKYDIKFRHEEAAGGDSYHLYWDRALPSSSITDYIVRVEVCTTIDRNVSHETNSCKPYPNGQYKPTGLLHDFGEDDTMMFGLLSGSYQKNLDGGVLRKAVSSFTDEVNLNTGQFNTSTNGIISTLNKLRTVNYDDVNYRYACGWITGRPINAGECDMWGNPVAEMMYESLRYFSGKGTPTTAFNISSSGNNDAALGLPLPSWDNPYDPTTGFDECAKPFQVVISDINPSYDSDKVPGSHSSFGSNFSGDISGLNVSSMADTITIGEGNIAGKKFFIGQSGSVSDNAPTAKSVSSLASIRGMAPEEPTKLGSYYSASIAYHGFINDINARAGDQNLQTFAVALASPLPTIEIDPDNNPATINSVIMVPFAKSPGQNSLWANFQPTNQIVDFYVESLTPTSGSFLINFEDVEQGADHDMDAIVRYTYTVNSDGTVTIDVDSVYAAGGIDQHMGYVISGTTKDGVYLEVLDRKENAADIDLKYSMDTPSGVWAGDPRGSNFLGLTASRTFTPSTTGGSASFLKDPLWYAAKWGGFIEKSTANNKPDQLSEWDTNNDGNPDNYFLVTNALTLKERMKAAFDEILARSGSASTVAASSGSLQSDTLLFQASFNTGGWTGLVKAIDFSSGFIGATNWEFSEQVRKQLARSNGHDANRTIITSTPAGKGVPFRFPANFTSPTTNEITLPQVASLLNGITSDHQDYGTDLVNYLRGENSEEEGINGATRLFRERQGDGGHKPIGDIINSDPLYVIQPGFFFPDTWPTTLNGNSANSPENSASQKYSTFKSALKNRDPMLFVGANDGMLHGMNAYKNENGISDGGEEILAYVPSTIYNKLPSLANPNYTHDFFVDGKTTYSDAFFSGDTRWHTALVGSLNSGGQAIFALDITDPKGITGSYPSFDESNADDLLLWEFTDADDPDLGFTFGRPTIIRLSNGQWGAVFGNGYNNTFADGTPSATGNAAIYIVNIETGALIKKFDTEHGLLQDPEGTARPNGMSEVTVVDANRDFIADYLYAGDLFGNVWKIDVRSTNANNWDFSFNQSGRPAPMYVAKSDNGNNLPITQRLIVRNHPKFRGSDNFLVAFGTGKYIEVNDDVAVDQETQSFFGIWDNGSNSFTRSDLLVQTIEEKTDNSNPPEEFRVVSNNTIRWEDEVNNTGTVTASKHGGWVLDLLDSNGSPLDNKGERSVTNAVLSGERIIFTTLIPSTDPCASGGSSWIMVVDSADGSATDSPFFDENNDSQFDNDDMIDTDGDGQGDAVKSGHKTATGIATTVTQVADQKGNTNKTIFGVSSGDAEVLDTDPDFRPNKRLYWRELQ